jgi:uncharacterized protein YdaU (DUF1376 family)
MNYYERHLGDYAKDAGHLSMLEHGAYTLLLDRYYTTEQGIEEEKVYRLCRAKTKEERAAVDAVLGEFFALVDGFWVNGRADREITKMQAKVKAAQENGKRGGRPKRTEEEPTGNPLGSVSVTQIKAHQPPDTSHQLNTPKPPRGAGGSVHEFPPGFDRLWESYPKKIGKDAAARAFAKRKPDEGLLARMLSAIAKQRQSDQWRKDGGQFIPHLATWLNQGRWEDEVDHGAQTSGAGSLWEGAL